MPNLEGWGLLVGLDFLDDDDDDGDEEEEEEKGLGFFLGSIVEAVRYCSLHTE
jgi:hypothetical protein